MLVQIVYSRNSIVFLYLYKIDLKQLFTFKNVILKLSIFRIIFAITYIQQVLSTTGMCMFCGWQLSATEKNEMNKNVSFAKSVD